MRVAVSGFKELEQALSELPKAVGKRVVWKVLTEAAQPIADAAAGMAPKRTGKLQISVGVGRRLSRAQAKEHQKGSQFEVHAGAGALPQAHLREFGSDGHPAHPFVRPAWDAGKMQALDDIGEALGREIGKAATRQARRAAKRA